jgi:hypothetical protein
MMQASACVFNPGVVNIDYTFFFEGITTLKEVAIPDGSTPF